jgi:hypothetical protein
MKIGHLMRIDSTTFVVLFVKNADFLAMPLMGRTSQTPSQLDVAFSAEIEQEG